MTLLLAGAPVGASGGLQPVATSNVVVQAVQTVQNTAVRVQLPQAVSATGLVAAFTPKTPQPTKPVLRAIGNGAASTLTAQLLGQSEAPSEQELAIFSPPSISAFTPQEDAQALVQSLQQARDEGAETAEAPAVPPAAQGLAAPRIPGLTSNLPPLAQLAFADYVLPATGERAKVAYRAASARNAALASAALRKLAAS